MEMYRICPTKCTIIKYQVKDIKRTTIKFREEGGEWKLARYNMFFKTFEEAKSKLINLKKVIVQKSEIELDKSKEILEYCRLIQE